MSFMYMCFHVYVLVGTCIQFIYRVVCLVLLCEDLLFYLQTEDILESEDILSCPYFFIGLF